MDDGLDINFGDGYQHTTPQLFEYVLDETPSIRVEYKTLKEWHEASLFSRKDQSIHSVKAFTSVQAQSENDNVEISKKDIAWIIAGLPTKKLQALSGMIGGHYQNNPDKQLLYKTIRSNVLADLFIQNGFITLDPGTKLMYINNEVIAQKLPSGYVPSLIKNFKKLEIRGMNSTRFTQVIRHHIQEVGLKEANLSAAPGWFLGFFTSKF